MIRTIHNAGCGSFCTESFYLPRRCKGRYFNMVYDCGSSDMEKEVRQEASNYFAHFGNIDILFISHFDKDHVNGIKALRRYMDKKTKVILPFFEDSYRLLSAKRFFHYYFDLVDYFHQNEIQTIFISADSDNNNERPIDIRELERNNMYSSGSVFKLMEDYFIWEYIPFNIQEHVDINSVKDICKEKGITDNELEDCIMHHQISDEMMEKLKEVYEDQRIKRYSETTRSNMSSMLLISKESALCQVKNSSIHIQKGWHTDINTNMINLSYSSIDNYIEKASCLYTGDAGLRKDEYFDIVLKYYRKHLPNGAGIMQIPHHGTVHYYPKNIFNQINMEMAFVNITLSSSSPLFYAQIPLDFANKHIPLYIVAQEPYSKIENSVELYTL